MQERAIDLIPKDAVLHHCYGMTETTFVTITGPYEKAESPGKVVSNIECKIIRGLNEICGPDEVGELWSVQLDFLSNRNLLNVLYFDGSRLKESASCITTLFKSEYFTVVV